MKMRRLLWQKQALSPWKLCGTRPEHLVPPSDRSASPVARGCRTRRKGMATPAGHYVHPGGSGVVPPLRADAGYVADGCSPRLLGYGYPVPDVCATSRQRVWHHDRTGVALRPGYCGIPPGIVRHHLLTLPALRGDGCCICRRAVAHRDGGYGDVREEGE